MAGFFAPLASIIAGIAPGDKTTNDIARDRARSMDDEVEEVQKRLAEIRKREESRLLNTAKKQGVPLSSTYAPKMATTGMDARMAAKQAGGSMPQVPIPDFNAPIIGNIGPQSGAQFDFGPAIAAARMRQDAMTTNAQLAAEHRNLVSNIAGREEREQELLRQASIDEQRGRAEQLRQEARMDRIAAERADAAERVRLEARAEQLEDMAREREVALEGIEQKREEAGLRYEADIFKEQSRMIEDQRKQEEALTKQQEQETQAQREANITALIDQAFQSDPTISGGDIFGKIHQQANLSGSDLVTAKKLVTDRLTQLRVDRGYKLAAKEAEKEVEEAFVKETAQKFAAESPVFEEVSQTIEQINTELAITASMNKAAESATDRQEAAERLRVYSEAKRAADGAKAAFNDLATAYAESQEELGSPDQNVRNRAAQKIQSKQEKVMRLLAQARAPFGFASFGSAPQQAQPQEQVMAPEFDQAVNETVSARAGVNPGYEAYKQGYFERGRNIPTVMSEEEMADKIAQDRLARVQSEYERNMLAQYGAGWRNVGR